MAFFDSTKMIIDPDNLYYEATSAAPATTANVRIDYFNKKIKLYPTGRTGAASGLSIEGGVTLKTLYSKMKEVWKSDATLIKFPFPMLPITDEQFEVINGWDFDKTEADTATDYTPNLIRTGGWALKDISNVTVEEYANVITLGTLAANTDQIYYTQTPLGSVTVTGTTSNFALTGPVNQAVKTYGTSGTFNARSYLKLFVREYEKTYANSTLTDIGVTTLTYQAYRFPVSTSTDVKITANSPPTASPYNGMSILWSSAPTALTATSASNYNIVINANGGTAKQVYEFVQYALRHGQRTDIDANAGATYVKYGEVTPDLLFFVGDTLYVRYQNVGPTGGIFINNIAIADKNSVYFYDNTNTQNFYAYLASLRINLGDNIINDISSKITLFFTNDNAPGDNTGRDYGTANALIVKDDSGSDIQFVLGSLATSATVIANKYIDFSYDYDGNAQRGAGSTQTDAPVTAVALGLSTAQFVTAVTTIGRSKSNSVSLVAPLERNYQNPA